MRILTRGQLRPGSSPSRADYATQLIVKGSFSHKFAEAVSVCEDAVPKGVNALIQESHICSLGTVLDRRNSSSTASAQRINGPREMTQGGCQWPSCGPRFWPCRSPHPSVDQGLWGWLPPRLSTGTGLMPSLSEFRAAAPLWGWGRSPDVTHLSNWGEFQLHLGEHGQAIGRGAPGQAGHGPRRGAATGSAGSLQLSRRSGGERGF